MKYLETDKKLCISPVSDFDLDETLDCGQCFRFERLEDASYRGIVQNRAVHLSKDGDTLILYGVTKEEYEGFWRGYFDLDTDYAAIKRQLSEDERLRLACAYCPGMRVLRQDPWEVLISFIISQNNNIGRIKGIIARLCAQFGDRIGEKDHAFPAPQTLAGLTLEQLGELRSGFRAKYILDAAQKVADGAVDLDRLRALPYEEAKEQLMSIRGVGDKVADCVLLYGYYRMEAFPKDVWIKRVLSEWYPGGLPGCCKTHAGIAQQYLFHYIRTSPERKGFESMKK
ncbi:DNA-3-methyladenine glycosylase family protein [Candidatus Soleaferrea massiliensis]|uniref:DNA-3-methyladenine glycosylase family protein n=1 Tax=Candidatus Soleaferrea massiliensis TaxID=1470354 RepID=UPI000693EBC4|nr:DNA glycosylase [Candidatus Soleaferrea massiliensis]